MEGSFHLFSVARDAQAGLLLAGLCGGMLKFPLDKSHQNFWISEGEAMHLVMLIVPVLVKVFIGLLGGLLGANMGHTTTNPAALDAKSSIGVVVVEKSTGNASGAAFVADKNLVLTTFHLVAGASRIRLKFPGSNWVEPKLLETDLHRDVAVLEVPDLSLRALPLGDLTKVREGDKVVAVGFPQAEERGTDGQTLEDGTVSGIRSDILLVQVSKTVGDDGGPILNQNGEAIGIVRGQLPGGGDPVTKFAIPPENAKVALAAAERDVLSATAAVVPPQSTSPAASPQQASVPPSPSPAAPSQPVAAPVATPVPPTQQEPTPPAPSPAAPPQPAPSPAPPSQQEPTPPAPSLAAPPQPVPSPAPPSQEEPAPAPSPAAPPQPAPTPVPPVAVSPQPTPVTPPAAPPPPEPTPAATRVSPEVLVVEPGKGIGPVKLGMRLQDVVSVLGPRKSDAQFSDGVVVYRWFEPPSNNGIGVRATKAGMVFRIWTLNDDRYVTKGGLHAGSSEGEILAVLGKPSRVLTDSASKTKILIYDSLGIWFTIQLDKQYKFYNAVFEIGIMEPAR